VKTRESQNRKVLAWLLKGRTLTAEQARAKWGIARLAARIYDIEGMPDEREWWLDVVGIPFRRYVVSRNLVTVRNREGRKVRVARYSL